MSVFDLPECSLNHHPNLKIKLVRGNVITYDISPIACVPGIRFGRYSIDYFILENKAKIYTGYKSPYSYYNSCTTFSVQENFERFPEELKDIIIFNLDLFS